MPGSRGYNASVSERVRQLAACSASNRLRSEMRTGHSGCSTMQMYAAGGFREPTVVAQAVMQFGLAPLDGYFPDSPCATSHASDTFLPWRSHAQAPSGDLQSGSGAPSDRFRPHRFAPQLPVLRLWCVRTRAESHTASSSLTRDADVYLVRENGALYCGRRLEGASQSGSIVGARALGRLRVREHFSFRSTHSRAERFLSVPSAVDGSTGSTV